MSNNTIVIDTPQQIDFYQLAAIKGAVKLELAGLKRRGTSAVAIAKQRYGLSGNKKAIYDQLCNMVEAQLHAVNTKVTQELVERT